MSEYLQEQLHKAEKIQSQMSDQIAKVSGEKLKKISIDVQVSEKGHDDKLGIIDVKEGEDIDITITRGNEEERENDNRNMAQPRKGDTIGKVKGERHRGIKINAQVGMDGQGDSIAEVDGSDIENVTINVKRGKGNKVIPDEPMDLK